MLIAHGIDAVAAVERVGARTAFKYVISGTAVQRIVPHTRSKNVAEVAAV